VCRKRVEMEPKNKGHNVRHNTNSDGFHVTKWENEGRDDRGRRESVDYTPSGGSWKTDESSRHSTDQNK